MMRKLILCLFVPLFFSCNTGISKGGRDIITVSIPPFKYFVEAIGGDDFDVNVMVPAGADPHIYEPSPGQVAALSKSKAYICDGFLGFEITWLDRFFDTNRSMEKLSLYERVDVIKADGRQHEGHTEGADPHFWISPRSAMVIAGSVKSLLCILKPENTGRYEMNFRKLSDTIEYFDKRATDLFSAYRGRTFMIFHPSLGYIARDYGINQVSVEKEGKEPSPSSMKELIDTGKRENIKVIFVQRGFDAKNAGAIASEIGAELKDIDPLGENWPESVSEIIDSIHESFITSIK